jgi:hypothetical protein
MCALNANNASLLVSGPVRRIGVQSRSITGTMPDGNRYESALERDFMLLLQFDPTVDVYTPQPLTLQYQDSDGNHHRYTPDGLIEWRSDFPVYDPRPLLVEIKYREAFQGKWRLWCHRVRAAKRYAKERGWAFEIFTERDIRTPLLDNARFLLPYLRRSDAVEVERQLLEILSDLVETTPRELIEFVSKDKWHQATLLPVLWRLLGQRSIGCDLTEPITMQSPIFALR